MRAFGFRIAYICVFVCLQRFWQNSHGPWGFDCEPRSAQRTPLHYFLCVRHVAFPVLIYHIIRNEVIWPFASGYTLLRSLWISTHKTSKNKYKPQYKLKNIIHSLLNAKHFGTTHRQCPKRGTWTHTISTLRMELTQDLLGPIFVEVVPESCDDTTQLGTLHHHTLSF